MQDPDSAAILELIFSNMKGERMSMRVRQNTRFGAMLNAYCTQPGLEGRQDDIRLIHNGMYLQAHLTPSYYDMEHGDCVDVFFQMRGD